MDSVLIISSLLSSPPQSLSLSARKGIKIVSRPWQKIRGKDGVTDHVGVTDADTAEIGRQEARAYDVFYLGSG